jgi:hypothetical protein
MCKTERRKGTLKYGIIETSPDRNPVKTIQPQETRADLADDNPLHSL